MTDVDTLPPPPGQDVPPLAPAARPQRPRRLDLTAWLASLGVLIALSGVVVLALPVHTPIHDCGSTFAYLYDGRYEPPTDPAKPPKGHTAAQVRRANAKPCRPRVADRAVLAAELILPGLALSLVAAGAEIVIRFRLRRRHAMAQDPLTP